MEATQTAVVNNATANQPTVNNVHLFMGRFILDETFRTGVEKSNFDVNFVIMSYPVATETEKKSFQRILGILKKQHNEAGFYVIIPPSNRALESRYSCGHPPC